MIPAISTASHGPVQFGGYNPCLAIDGINSTFQHTNISPEKSWWKGVFKTTVFIKSFTIVARPNYHQRINNLDIVAVVYKNRKSQEFLIVDTNSLPFITEGAGTVKSFTIPGIDGIEANEVMVRMNNPQNYLNFAEIYINGY